MSRSELACPAATLIAGPDGTGASLCGVLARDRDHERVVAEKGTEREAVFSARRDPRTFFGYCSRTGGLDSAGNPLGYEACVVWVAEKRRVWARRERGQASDVEG